MLPPEYTDCREELLKQNWQGFCYTACRRWVMVSKEYGWMIVHGSAVDHHSGERLNHAWCECGEQVLDLTSSQPSKFVDKQVYYKAGSVEVHNEYTAVDAIVLSIRTGHDGPWTADERSDLSP